MKGKITSISITANGSPKLIREILQAVAKATKPRRKFFRRPSKPIQVRFETN